MWEKWNQHLTEIMNSTLLAETDSWWNGGNIKSGQRNYLTYVGGFSVYSEIAEDVKQRNYEGFILTALSQV